ncbi:glycosyltransferase involved in cell wall biosynthesis [Caulobacter ginsengisoli]|uniref:Glycosyltransferase involved in cell wall biosynthesis n=1 Tax=Caulobacter ginsengisoli TaxID=400775 RepID=A0ABU0IR46_9CAUL|nr:glycosyltransferase family 4 protein [Caulobacter ginsengisoli]MDQ0464485.1 glycosyltransferase involved in cell wall biosynthesis [Caulobacter ginsengisoli]
MAKLPRNFTLLQVTPELETGGAEQTTLDITRAVVRAGGRSVVASKGGRMAAQLQADGGRLYALPMQSKNPLTIISNTGKLLDLIRRENVSLVHARSRAPALSALWAAQAAGVPFLATYHGIYKAGNAIKRAYNAVMTRGAVVIANSDYTRDHVLAEHRLDPKRVVTIPRGVDLVRFDPKAVSPGRLADLRQEWQMRMDDPRLKVVLGGRLSPIKGHLSIVQAMAILKAQGRDDILVIFAGDDQGRSEYRAEILAAIAKNDLADRVKVVGHCDDMPAAYLACDMAMLPTLKPESFGRAAVEPQAMGRPVLVSNHGGAAETVVEGETGWKLPVGDAAAWAAGLAAAADTSVSKRAAMGKAAMLRARKLYSVDAMCAATLDVYARVLENRA